MNETDEYILNAIKSMVWSGFYTPEDVDQMIDDILEDDADEAFLRAAVAPEFAKKKAAEASWPAVTDCDRLDVAFRQLNDQGIVALQNAGTTMSDGLYDVSEAMDERGRAEVRGYCFYHGQDLDRAVAGAGLHLAFGSVDDDIAGAIAIVQDIKGVMEANGFTVEWNGDPKRRLELSGIDWKRRGPG